MVAEAVVALRRIGEFLNLFGMMFRYVQCVTLVFGLP